MIADYAYEQYFTMDNIRKDILIVEEGATLTVENDKSITVGNSTFTIRTEDFVSEKFELSRNLCSENTLTYGKCESAMCRFTIGNTEIANLKDKWIVVYLYFNGNGDTLFEVGHFRVNEDVYSDSRRQRTVTAYDILYTLLNCDVTEYFNKTLYADETDECILSEIVDGVLNYCATQYSFPESFVYSSVRFSIYNVIPFEELLFKKPFTSDVIKAGAIIERAFEICAFFGRVTNENEFIAVKLADITNNSTPHEISKSITKPPVKYQDSTTPVIADIRCLRGNEELTRRGNKITEGQTYYTIKDNPYLVGLNSYSAGWTIGVDRVLNTVFRNVSNKRYKPLEITCMSNLCLEPGDLISAEGIEGSTTYILCCTTKGIQQMFDTYSARYNAKNGGYGGSLGNSWNKEIANSVSQNQGGYTNIEGYNDTNLPELMRNFGYRLLDEPSDVSCVLNESDNSVTLKWTDPDDLTDDKPIPAYWKGTVVVRKEGSAPLNIYDGTIVVETTLADDERDIYSENGYVDSGLESNIKYFYGIFPYTDDGIEKDYRWTKVVTANTNILIDAPKIISAVPDGRTVTVNYHLPTGSYSSRKIVYKANDIPKNENDGSYYNIGAGQSGDNYSTITNLQPTTTYYFVIFDTDSNGRTAVSNAISCTTGTVSTTVLFDMHDSDSYTHPCVGSPTTRGTSFSGATWDNVEGAARNGYRTGTKYWEYPSPYNVATTPDADLFCEIKCKCDQWNAGGYYFRWFYGLRFLPNGWYNGSDTYAQALLAIEDDTTTDRTLVAVNAPNFMLRNLTINQYHTYRYEFKIRNGRYTDKVKIYVDGTLAAEINAPNLKAIKPFGTPSADSDNSMTLGGIGITSTSGGGCFYAKYIKVWYES